MTAITDIKNKIIRGAKNERELAHERSHIEFSESELGMNIQWIGQMSEYFTIICLTISLFVNFFKWFCLIGVAIMIFTFVYEEIYCN